MGYRDLDLWFFWFGVSCAKGSATAQPSEIPAFHVSPRCLYPLVHQSTSTFSAIFTTTTTTIPTTRRTYYYPRYLYLIFWTCTRQRVGLVPDYQIIHPKPLICIFSADATQIKFSAGIRQPTRRRCISIRYQSRAPVNSHQSKLMEGCALTASEGKDQAFGVRDAARVAGLGEREPENVMPCVFMSLPAISLPWWTCLPLAHLPCMLLFFC